jgi:NAD(P)-dependent dehydrogenase (short-subunit alcohol dehydrogenase family)
LVRLDAAIYPAPSRSLRSGWWRSETICGAQKRDGGKKTEHSGLRRGLVMLSKAAAVEYAKEGIRVNCIHPGVIEQTAQPLFAARVDEGVARQHTHGTRTRP